MAAYDHDANTFERGREGGGENSNKVSYKLKK